MTDAFAAVARVLAQHRIAGIISHGQERQLLAALRFALQRHGHRDD